ncbi:MAG: hypothetical protein ACJA08_002922, partial [Cyclobacteriaceae bacterium]
MTSNFIKFLSLSVFTCSTLATAFGQEICNDGVDNNNDGYIDCYDELCANTADCSDFYLGNSVV